MNQSNASRSSGIGVGGYLLRFVVGPGLLTLVVVGPVVFFAGVRRGKEFSPVTFDARSYAFNEIPFFQVQYTPISRTDETPSLATYLQVNKLVGSQVKGVKKRWDLVNQFPVSHNAKLDAAILYQYLELRDADGALVWETWSDEHPKLAAILWPRVSVLAQFYLYIFTPELFDLAAESVDAEQFERQADMLLAAKLTLTGDYAAAAGKHQRAIKYYDAAIEYNAENADALEGKTKSQRAIETGAD